MKKIDKIPIIVRQTIESLLQKGTPEHVCYNNMIMLENIRDCADEAIKTYNKKNQKI